MPFTTNASESINAVLKQKVNYKRNELPVFLEKIKELIREQDSDIEKAVIDRGKYKINPEFKKLSKTEEEWFTKMKEGDRIRHLQRFSTFKIPDVSASLLSRSSPTGGARHGPGNIPSHHSGYSSDLGSGHGFCHDSGYSFSHSSKYGFHQESGHVSLSSEQGPLYTSALSSTYHHSEHCAHSSRHGSPHHTVHGSALTSGHNSPHHDGYDSALSGHSSVITSGHDSALTSRHISPR